MDEPKIPFHVAEACAQRDLYYSYKKLKDAQDVVKESGIENVAGIQEIQIAEFLKQRGIHHNTPLEKLIDKPEDNVILLGTAFYFSRKFFVTSHDCSDEIRSPLPWIQNVFDGLVASNGRHATKILEELCDLSSKEPDNQRRVVAVVEQLLPLITAEYIKSLEVLDHTYRTGSSPHNTEKSKLDKSQMDSLDKLMQYAKHVIKTHQEPSHKGFRKFSGLPDKPENGAVRMNEQYIVLLLREEKDKLELERKPHTAEQLYGNVITRIEREVGPLVSVSNHRDREVDGINLSIYTGDTRNPIPHQLFYSRKNGHDPGILYAICDHIRSKSDVPQELKTTTAISRTGIASYFKRG